VSRDVIDDPPPFLGTWRRVYAAVAVYLAVLITSFWLFAKAWS
jgi:hypothetical protein